MKILVCPASPEIIEQCSEGLFLSKEGKSYLYQVEYVEDEYVRITDSVGRVMPFDIDEITSIAEILGRINRFRSNTSFSNAVLVKQLMTVNINNEENTWPFDQKSFT